MKGTAPRDPDPIRDGELAEELRASEKGRAENLMIVDLLRNDISRIAKVGSVRVPKLFAVESYATLHQMISRVVGDLTEAPALSRLMPALFPCGSITGAPKIRAMQIIAEVEPHPRAPIAGRSAGWRPIAPAVSTCDPHPVLDRRSHLAERRGRGGAGFHRRRGMGGGALESALSERARDPGLRLIETLLWDGSGLSKAGAASGAADPVGARLWLGGAAGRSAGPPRSAPRAADGRCKGPGDGGGF